jgi:hypothetical protein
LTIGFGLRCRPLLGGGARELSGASVAVQVLRRVRPHVPARRDGAGAKPGLPGASAARAGPRAGVGGFAGAGFCRCPLLQS